MNQNLGGSLATNSEDPRREGELVLVLLEWSLPVRRTYRSAKWLTSDGHCSFFSWVLNSKGRERVDLKRPCVPKSREWSAPA